LSKNTAIGDGFTAVADLDMDGKLEVVIAKVAASNTVVYVWRPDVAGGGAGSYKSYTVTNSAGAASTLHGFPFIGDIDGAVDAGTNKKYPEICITTVNAVTALKYNPSTDTHSQLWKMLTTDGSGGTGITLFDFNNDGASELVYRDEDSLRIVDGTAGVNKTAIACLSGTAWEYPVIADTDGDGSANICVSCAAGKNTPPYNLAVFSSATQPWAPTRKVWNRISYESLQINEDLTVPGYFVPKNMEFNGKYPYNGALIQAPIMAKGQFNVVQFSPDPAVDRVWLEEITSDSVHVWVRIRNLGVRNTNASLPVALYGAALPGASLVAVQPVGLNIAPGETGDLYFGIPSSALAPAMSVRIQDDGSKYPADGSFLDCDLANNLGYVSGLLAFSDRVMAFGTATFDPLANDSTGLCGRNTLTAMDTVARSGPRHGTLTILPDRRFTYTPAPDFRGLDSLDYYIRCGADSSAARVYIAVFDKPDNIIGDANCVISPPQQEWAIQRVQRAGYVATTTQFVVGDLNDDGYPEIVNFDSLGRANMVILWGPEFTSASKYPLGGAGTGAIAIAKVKTGDAPETFQQMIFYQMGNSLCAMKPDGTSAWATNPSFREEGMIGVADFNGDGWAEVYAGNQIYDAATGKPLCDGGAGENSGGSYLVTAKYSLVAAVDILGDEKLELVAGNKIYGVDIDRSVATPKSLTLLSSVTPPGGFDDGVTVVADFNNDGNLEVLVRRKGGNSGSTNNYLYLWTPHTGTATGSLLASTYDTNVFMGVPFVGDIDGDGKIEIVTLDANGVVNVTQSGTFRARKYNETAGTFDLFWAMDHTDQSGATGMTLFDFNNDGISEIVYRDEQELRIINGSKKHHLTGKDTTVYTLQSFVSYSETGTEYPVVADIYGNGTSAILVTSDTEGPRNAVNPPPGTNSQGFTGAATIDIFTSNPATPWVPARKVWNQYGYNAVNINEDLTVPKRQFDLATVLPGPDGKTGTADDVRPYNAFLQQQTLLDERGLPVWLAPNAVIVSTVYDYHSDGDSLLISVTFANTGDAATHTPFHITAYRNTVAAGNILTVDNLMEQVAPGNTATAVVTVRRYSSFLPLDRIVIRLNDSGQATGYEQPECNESDNDVTDPGSKVLGLFDDVQTVQLFHYVEIDILANDNLPPAVFTPAFSLLDSITVQPLNGSLSVSGSGGSSKLHYTNAGTGSLTDQIDSFSYRFTYYHPDLQEWRTDSATAYIYILEDRSGVSACYATDHTVRLAARPSGVSFEWYTLEGQADGSGSTRLLPAMTSDASWLIRPDVPGPDARWNRAGGFPRGRFSLHVSGETPAPMRWTGLVSHDWHNPANWVELSRFGNTSFETPVSWLPSACTDVEIPSDILRYPELTDSAACRVITVRDRAMLRNPHVLDYDSARVELVLKATERDRFVMWSAPLKHMYSGDYHFRKNDLTPTWGDIQMNLFQQSNPDPGGGIARADMLTATFGEPGLSLGLGTAFNLKVISTSESRDRPWNFPQSATAYPGVQSLDRDSSHRFITDGVQLTGSPATFDLPVTGGSLTGSTKHMIQVVNPYLAYLEVSKFLEGNSGELADGYLIWDGHLEDGFAAVKYGDAGYQQGMRYVYTDPASVTPEYIPPLQSFFVAKRTPGSVVTSVKMSPEWTTTELPDLTAGYRLRSAEAAVEGVLRIRASQDSRTDYAVLHFDRNASPEYNSHEDVRALFYDETPLTVYALTALREPLAIYASGDFQSQTTGLGLRLRNTGEVTLTFSGMERFGHNIYLLDREKNRTVDLHETPEYTFTAVGSSTTSAVEINDRFVLQMQYTGVWNEPVEVRPEALTVTSQNGEIHVRSTWGIIRELQVYTLAGTLVYATATAATEYRIPVGRRGVYIVRADFGEATETKKVMVGTQ
ncbi:MAG: FG-GAP-like repeat-containing protein, partial [Tannerella sp.]|nr:FG-GAP-like repeat-containing protein [Tannerella sp.]